MAKILELRMNDNASGVGTAIADTSGNGYNFIAIIPGSDGAWSSDSQGRWLACTAAPDTSGFNAWQEMNTGLGAALQGLTQFSLVLKPKNLALGAYPYSPLFTIAATGGATEDMQFMVFDAGSGGVVGFNFAGGERVWYGADDLAWVIVVDTTQATAADRIKAYRKIADGSNLLNGSMPFGTLPALNAAMTGINDASTFMTLFNTADQNNNVQGGIAHLRFDTQLYTQAQAFSILDNLMVNDDNDPFVPPTLAWLATPSVVGGSLTTNSVTTTATTSLAAEIDVVVTTAGGMVSQPPEAAFDNTIYGGNSTASTAFPTPISGLTANTTYRMWYRARTAGQTNIYGYADVTTLAASTAIISVNGGQPIRRGQTGVVVMRQGGATGTTATTWNGVAQANHTVISDFESRFDVVWPNMLYGNTADIVIGAQSILSPPLNPPTGYNWVVLSGYNPSGTIGEAETTPAAVDGNQFVWNTEGGTILFAANGLPEFTAAFDGNVTFAVVDSADGAHSSFVTLPYGSAPDTTVNAFSLGADVINADPGVITTRSFVIAGATDGVDISFGAIGVAEISHDNTTWVSTRMFQNGQTVYVRGAAGALGLTVQVGVTGGGQSDLFDIITREAAGPTITVQPQPATVSVGQTAGLTVTAINASSYQWYVQNVPVSGATGTLFNFSSSQAGNYPVTVVVTSPEGVSVTSTPAVVTVVATNTRIRMQSFYDLANVGNVMANAVVSLRIRTPAGQTVVATQNYTLDASGNLQIIGSLGAPGNQLVVEYITVDGDYIGFNVTVEANT